MDVFWPGAEPAAACNNLHVAMSLARKALSAAWPHPVIERRFAGYRITDQVEVWTDVEHFERSCNAGQRADRAGDRAAARHSYETACQLYEGDFLAEEPYTDWAAARANGCGCTPSKSRLAWSTSTSSGRTTARQRCCVGGSWHSIHATSRSIGG